MPRAKFGPIWVKFGPNLGPWAQALGLAGSGGPRILGTSKMEGLSLGLGPYIYQLAGCRLQTDSMSATRCRHANPQGLLPASGPRSLVAPEGAGGLIWEPGWQGSGEGHGAP